MEYGIFSANEFIYTDTKGGKKEISLVAARNSYLCVQILCKDTAQINVTWESKLAATPEINQMLPVYVERNCGTGSAMVIEPGSPCDYSARVAPFNVYDCLEPTDGKSLTADKFGNIALYLRWSTANLAAGIYTGKLFLNNEEVPVTLTVAEVEIPKEETLRVTNWFNIYTMAEYHGAKAWSEEHWDMIKKYGEVMRSIRQTDFWVPCASTDYVLDSNGDYIFDFSKAKRLIELYLSLGFTHIEAAPILSRPTWKHAKFFLRIDGEIVDAFTEKGLTFIRCFFTQWYAFIKENGWEKITQQHVGDEPHPGCFEEYCKLSELIRGYMPGIKIIEAVETTLVNGYVDTWVTTIKGYEESSELHKEYRKNGVEFWFYTCCYPGGKYVNRLLDNELIRTRYLHWINYIYDFKGYLHWGFNFYSTNGGDPFTGACNRVDAHMEQILPAGDTHIVYPKGNQVLRSVRLEMMRAGVEDYELIKMLAEIDRAAADDIVKKCVRSFTDYTKDIDCFEKAYSELLERLS